MLQAIKKKVFGSSLGAQLMQEQSLEQLLYNIFQYVTTHVVKQIN